MNVTPQKGAVFMEFAVVLPLLVFLIVAITDFGLFLQSYFRASHIAREGLKYAQSMSGLPSGGGAYGTTFVISNDAFATTSPINAYPVGHQRILGRMAMLLSEENGSAARRSLQLVNNQALVSSQCIIGDGGDRNLDRVEVVISAVYDPILPVQQILQLIGFGRMPTAYRITADGSYLFAQCA